MGTQKQNVKDSIVAGTHSGAKFCGESKKNAVLTNKSAVAIYKKYWNSSEAISCLAKAWGVGYGVIRGVVSGRTWRHVTGMTEIVQLQIRKQFKTKGEYHYLARLTEKKVARIRKERDAGKSLLRLARKYNISVSTAHCIVTRKTWKHVP